MHRPQERAPPDRHRFVLRLAALVAVAVAAAGCQHTGDGGSEAAGEYDSMQISPPVPTATMGGGAP